MEPKTVRKELVRRLSEKLGEGFTVGMETILKNNGVEKTGISIQKDGDILEAVLYPRGLEEFCQKELSEDGLERHTDECADGPVVKDSADRSMGSMEKERLRYVETCTEELLQQYKAREDQELREMVHRIMDWEAVRPLIRPQLLSCKENQRLLGRLVCKRLQDLAIVYAVQVGLQNENGSIYVKRRLLEDWGISEEELHRQALNNMEADGYAIRSLSELLCEEMPVPAEEIGPFPAVLTNQRRLYGAAGILLGDMLKAYAEKMRTNFFLIPSSIHEFLLVPDDGKTAQDLLNLMVREVNETEVREEDRLSDHVYYYDRETKRIEMEKKVPVKHVGEDGLIEGKSGEERLLGAV